ncbi:MAG: 16S rRNA (cytosine(967)-C(5))-methyltransferase RsmB [Thermosulfidibacteraceae bacterium]
MTVRERIYRALVEIEEGAYSGEVLRKYVEEPDPLNRMDRKLLWEVVLGVLKWKYRLDETLSTLVKRYRKLDEKVKILLRSGCYQIHFLDRVPPYSVVSECVEVAKRNLPAKYAKFVNAVLRKLSRKPFPVLKSFGSFCRTVSVFYSYPEFMINRWLGQFGVDEFVPLIREMNGQSPFTLWINVHFTDLNTVRKLIREEHPDFELKPYRILPREMVQLVAPIDITKVSLFKEGLVTPQDPASRLVTKILDAREGEIILDACAAPGIKTAQIALSMGNKGRVVAFEIDPDRFENLLYNVKRLGATIVEARKGDVTRRISEYDDEFFDRILVDAPCSDLGTIRRRPEIKYRRTMDDIASFSKKQMEILKAVVSKLKKKGVLVYSVCSFEEEETMHVYNFCLEKLNLEPLSFDDILEECGLENCIRGDGYVYLLPHMTGSDGFFIARFRRR